MADIPTNKLSIYLIKNLYSSPEDILKNFEKLTKEEIKYGTETIGTLYYCASHLFEPSWIKDFFGSSFENNSEKNTGRDENRKLKLFNASYTIGKSIFSMLAF